MKVELLTTVKYGSGKYFFRGEIYSDPIPSVLLDEVKARRGTVLVLNDSTPSAPIFVEKVVEQKKEEEVILVPEPPKVKVPIKKVKIIRRSK